MLAWLRERIIFPGNWKISIRKTHLTRNLFGERRREKNAREREAFFQLSPFFSLDWLSIILNIHHQYNCVVSRNLQGDTEEISENRSLPDEKKRQVCWRTSTNPYLSSSIYGLIAFHSLNFSMPTIIKTLDVIFSPFLIEIYLLLPNRINQQMMRENWWKRKNEREREKNREYAVVHDHGQMRPMSIEIMSLYLLSSSEEWTLSIRPEGDSLIIMCVQDLRTRESERMLLVSMHIYWRNIG